MWAKWWGHWDFPLDKLAWWLDLACGLDLWTLNFEFIKYLELGNIKQWVWIKKEKLIFKIMVKYKSMNYIVRCQYLLVVLSAQWGYIAFPVTEVFHEHPVTCTEGSEICFPSLLENNRGILTRGGFFISVWLTMACFSWFVLTFNCHFPNNCFSIFPIYSYCILALTPIVVPYFSPPSSICSYIQCLTPLQLSPIPGFFFLYIATKVNSSF